MRASVIRLWALEQGELGTTDIKDLIRFNEAIDQSLAESVARYASELDRPREMFLAILGHDLRTPLGAVITSATFMLDLGELEEPYRTLMSRIASSSRCMDRMVGDLLDLTRSRLGGGTIHNLGAPIPAAMARRIFDPMKRRQSGSSAHLGLGLYIAERILAAHNGRIAVESSASAGTTLSVYLPRSE